MEKQRWEELEKRREEKRREEKRREKERRSEKRKSQKKEDAGASRNSLSFSNELWLRRVEE